MWVSIMSHLHMAKERARWHASTAPSEPSFASGHRVAPTLCHPIVGWEKGVAL